ncbi:hypothetical protein NQ042_12660 [Corynebacterium phoceense]|uniref:hypothetical protein n=1 Tax=Corynebacterium phoceense TaxID=1686286 RepID=UPI00211B8439|nr:hypothetical protein [Corynebacterium phoceense]MCQ9334916.1 hypothetical protein [Corynebacterium phoceense]MCQ9337195.1 hypothetical protein [Corynebacterium phoceense]
MTSTELESSSKRGKIPWIVAVLILVVVLIAIIIVKLVSNDESSEQQAQSPGPAPASSASNDPDDANEKKNDHGWDSPTADIFGRNIRVPSNGVGNPLGKAEAFDSTQCDISDPLRLTIEQTSGTQTVWSESQGPSKVASGGAPVDYSRSAQAALLSAWNDMALFYAGGDISVEVAKTRFSAPNLDKLVDKLEAEGTPKSPNAVNQSAPDAFRITSCSDDRVIGDVALPMPTDASGDEKSPTWTVVRLAALWEDGDWKTQLGSTPQPPEEEIDNLEGWTKWRY